MSSSEEPASPARSRGVEHWEEANIAVVRRWHHEVWSQGDLSVIDEIVADDYVKHWASLSDTVGREELKCVVTEWRAGFPDWFERVDDIRALGDLVFVRWTEGGTFTGDMQGQKATGRYAEVAAMGWLRLHDGRIVEEWTIVDDWGTQLQAGLVYAEETYEAGWD